MLQNYIVVAFRSLLKNKTYVIVNALVIGIALACCLTAYVVLAYDLEFDDFHADNTVANVFTIHTHLREQDGTIIRNNSVPMPLPSMAAPEIAGIERFTRYLHEPAYMRYGDKAFTEKISFADNNFFDMFDFPLVYGDHQSFKDKHTIFLSEEIAIKYFVNEDAIGKTILINFQNETELEAIVGGVLKKVPINNTFNFGAMMRIENFQDIHKDLADNSNPSTFVELTSAASAPAVSKALNKYVPVINNARKNDVVSAFQLEPFKARFTSLDVNPGHTTLRTPVNILTMFTAMAALILLAACFNLTNTTIAMTGRRLKEIGIRKTIGASRKHIVSQFLMETIIMITLSLGVGLLLAQWIVPAFNSLYNVPFTLNDVNGLNLVITLVALIFFASIIAGIYPALLNSRFKPIVLLKSNARLKGTSVFTRTLIVLQFSLSVIVLIGGVVFTQNAAFQEAINFGYDKEKIITVNIQNEKEFEALESIIVLNSKILSIAVSEHNVGQSSYESTVKAGNGEHTARFIGIGKNYLETMGLKLHEGRFLNITNTSDRNEAIIVNRAFVDRAGLKNPLDEIVMVNDTKRRIVGVIENHVDDIFISDMPPSFVFYATDPASYRLMQVRAETTDLSETRDDLEASWKKIFPTRPFESQYQEDIVLGDARMLTGSFKSIFSFLAILGGLLAVSGIFSLASLNIARRTKEIGIRKAHGATVANVITLINREFVIILGLAALAGCFGGFYLINALLGVFNMQHTGIGLLTVATCGLAIFCIGTATTSFTILKAARTNPVETLKSE